MKIAWLSSVCALTLLSCQRPLAPAGSPAECEPIAVLTGLLAAPGGGPSVLDAADLEAYRTTREKAAPADRPALDEAEKSRVAALKGLLAEARTALTICGPGVKPTAQARAVYLGRLLAASAALFAAWAAPGPLPRVDLPPAAWGALNTSLGALRSLLAAIPAGGAA